MARRSGQVIFDTISNLTFHYVGLDYFWGEGKGDVFFPSENKEHVTLCTANLTSNYTSSMQNAAALSGSASCAMPLLREFFARHICVTRLKLREYLTYAALCIFVQCAR